MDLINGFDSNYRYILVRAKRARQLQSGASPLIETSSQKPCRIAEQEIQAQKVKWSIPEPKPALDADGEAAPEPGSDE
jgi:DNA-directed RNA polymerase subunit omega